MLIVETSPISKTVDMVVRVILDQNKIQNEVKNQVRRHGLRILTK